MLHSGEVNLKCGSLAWLANACDVSMVVFDNTVNHGKAQAGAFPDFLGGEEGIKDIFQGGFIHPLTRVVNREENIFPRSQLGLAAAIIFIQNDIPRFDSERATIGHCIPCIHRKIHQDLFNLRGIGIDMVKVAREMQFNLDHLGDGSFQQQPHILHNPVEVNGLEL